MLESPNFVGTQLSHAPVQEADMGTEIRYMRIRLKGRCEPELIPKLRGAICATVSPEEDLFHNHTPAGSYLHRYPLIQYRAIGGFAYLVCFNEGVDAVQEWMVSKPEYAQMGEQELDLGIDEIQAKSYRLRTWNKMMEYRIRRYIPFQGEQFGDFHHARSLRKRIEMLETKIRNHLVAVNFGLGRHEKSEILVDILKIHDWYPVSYKNHKHIAFDIRFQTNMFLPEFIGVGKAAAMGFGVIKSVREGKSWR